MNYLTDKFENEKEPEGTGLYRPFCGVLILLFILIHWKSGIPDHSCNTRPDRNQPQ